MGVSVENIYFWRITLTQRHSPRDPSSSHSCRQPQQPLHHGRASQSISHSLDTISSNGLDTWRGQQDEVAGLVARTPALVFALSGGDWMAWVNWPEGCSGVGWNNHVPRGGGTLRRYIFLPSPCPSLIFTFSLPHSRLYISLRVVLPSRLFVLYSLRPSVVSTESIHHRSSHAIRNYVTFRVNCSSFFISCLEGCLLPRNPPVRPAF